MDLHTNIEEGQVLRDQGAATAAANAENAEPGWLDRATNLMLIFARNRTTFMTEDVAEWAEQTGLPKPPDRRAWGQVALRAQRKGLIKHVGYAARKRSSGHAGPCSVWSAV